MSAHTDAKNGTCKSVIFLKTPRVRLFGLTRCVKNYPTNEIGAFAHVSQLGGAQIQNSLARAHIRNDGEDIRQVAPSLFRRLSSFNRTIISSSLELLVLEISMFSLYDFDKRVNTCSLSDKRVSEA